MYIYRHVFLQEHFRKGLVIIIHIQIWTVTDGVLLMVMMLSATLISVSHFCPPQVGHQVSG